MTESFLCGWKGHGRHSEPARLIVSTAEVFDDDDDEFVPDYWFFAGDDVPIGYELDAAENDVVRIQGQQSFPGLHIQTMAI